MNAPLIESISVPRHIVRPLMDGEALPFYSTDELWRGVCHLVPGADQVQHKRKNKGLVHAVATRLDEVERRIQQYIPTIKEMAALEATDMAIAAKLGISRSYVSRLIRLRPELRRLSANRVRAYGSHEASVSRFKAHEKEIREDEPKLSPFALSKKYGFHQYTLQRLLAEAK